MNDAMECKINGFFGDRDNPPHRNLFFSYRTSTLGSSKRAAVFFHKPYYNSLVHVLHISVIGKYIDGSRVQNVFLTCRIMIDHLFCLSFDSKRPSDRGNQNTCVPLLETENLMLIQISFPKLPVKGFHPDFKGNGNAI